MMCDVSGVMRQVREMRESMVMREAYEGLVNQLRQLGVGVEGADAEFQADSVEEHTCYTGDGGVNITIQISFRVLCPQTDLRQLQTLPIGSSQDLALCEKPYLKPTLPLESSV